MKTTSPRGEPGLPVSAFFDEESMKWGFIDSKGDVKVAPEYDKISNFGGGLAVVSEEP